VNKGRKKGRGETLPLILRPLMVMVKAVKRGGRAFNSGKERCKATAPTTDVVVTKLASVWY